MKTIIEQIVNVGLNNPEKIALNNGITSISYRMLLENIMYAKKVIEEEYGLKKGDAVILAADKQPEFVSLYFACHLIGVKVLPIAPDTNAKRYEHIKTRVFPSLIIGFKDEEAECSVIELNIFKDGREEFDLNKLKYPSLDDIADIIFTTGTTGEPKGVQLTHRNISGAAQNINTFIRNISEDVELLALPISHSFGIGRMRCALSRGQTLIMLGSFANVKRFFRFMKEYHVTGFGMVPASWALLKKMSGMQIGEYKDQLNYIEIGSAPMPLEEKQSLLYALPHTRICMHYGLTEASRSAFIEFHESKEYLDTVGKESPNMHIMIKDEYGKDVPCGEDGEICVKGDAVTIGYIDLPHEDSFWGEYFRTGDWGFLDQDGYLTLRSRKKELINVGGKKVSPLEVETVLMEIDFIKDCACASIPDPEGILGEVVKAYIVTEQPELAVFKNIDKMIGQKLEGYKHPIEYVVIDEIPKTTSGKVQRLLLK